MDAIGFLFEMVAYFVVTAGTVAAVIWRVDAKTPVPWASPWRIRSPKLATAAGPALFILFFPVLLTGLPMWCAGATVIGALIAPWVGAVLITIEWLRRRAEDRATGLPRPVRPWI